MSKIKNNALLQEVHGKMGKTHSYRKVRGQMFMVNLPEGGKPLTPERKAFVDRFQKAVNYAKARILQPEFKAQYQTGVNKKKHSAYLVAISDSLNAPKVNEIKAADYQGAVGDIIRIDATDDFKVIRVRVIIYDPAGNKVEQGDAGQDPNNSHIWKYAATAINPEVAGSTVSVTAFDLADNESTLEVEL